jgi:hypothetical protein
MAGELPASFVQQFREAAPSYRPGQNEEADALFNPSITARPLHVPMAGQIQKRLNREMEYFWAFDRLGQNPYHERVDRLRAVGFEYATTKDVQMAVDDVIKGKDDKGFSNEIRNGDLRLMKVPKQRWLEIRKSQQLQAIMMMNPRGKAMGDDGTVMGVQSLIPGVRTTVTDEPIEDIRARAVVSDAAKDLADGQIRGNASVVSKDSINKTRG